MPSQIDITRLSQALKAKRGNRGLRDVAGEITSNVGKVSTSTLSRIELGKVPDLETFVKICDWLGASTQEFVVVETKQHVNKIQKDTPELIEAHLRADRVLEPETIAALTKMVKLAYSEAKKGSFKKS